MEEERFHLTLKAGMNIVHDIIDRMHAAGETVLDVYKRQPVWSVTPGQSAVFYDGDMLLGGGYLKQFLSQLLPVGGQMLSINYCY